MHDRDRDFNGASLAHEDVAHYLRRAEELRSAYIIGLASRGAAAVKAGVRRLASRITGAVADAGHTQPAAGCRGGAL